MFTTADKREIAGRARTLHERVAGPANEAVGDPPLTPETVVERWEALYPTEEAFTQRLETDGLTREGIETHVAGTHWPAEEPLPEWVDELESLIAHVQAHDPAAYDPEQTGVTDPAGFEELLACIAAYAREEVSADGVAAETIDPLERWLVTRLEGVSVRPLYVEFQSYLHHEAPELVDADPASCDELPTAQYEGFIQAMFGEGVANLALEYPVLVRQWVRLLRDWQATVRETLDRVQRDRDALAETFGVSGAVESFEVLGGDPHEHGRVPMRVTFENGEVIYKPRSVSGGAVLYTVIDRLDDHLETPSFDTPAYLTRDEYGWMEPVSYGDLSNADAAERYYERAGVVLCLGYALRCSDWQVDNVVAAGDQPVIVDGETVLNPAFDPTQRLFEGTIAAAIDRSVLWTALLPWYPGDPHQDGDDSQLAALSGFGESSETAEWADEPQTVIEHQNTDLMTVGTEPGVVDRATNTPSVGETDHPPRQHIDSLLRGFDEAYETIRELHAADQFFTEIAPSSMLASATTRPLYRATETYMQTLNAMTGRDPLRDGTSLTLAMEGLAVSFLRGRYRGRTCGSCTPPNVAHSFGVTCPDSPHRRTTTGSTTTGSRSTR